jgi:hypothetical protein
MSKRQPRNRTIPSKDSRPVKECRICHRILPIEEFYKCPSCYDGYGYICNDCVNERNRKKLAEKLSDPVKREEYRKKSHESWIRRYNRYNLADKHKWMDKFGTYIRHTGLRLKAKGYDMTGKQAHHWNYNEPNCVFILTPEAHRAIHRYIKVNHDDGFCYLKKDGTRIETADQAREIFTDILNQCGIKEDFDLVIF